jgi:hypothetical protein
MRDSAPLEARGAVDSGREGPVAQSPLDQEEVGRQVLAEENEDPAPIEAPVTEAETEVFRMVEAGEIEGVGEAEPVPDGISESGSPPEVDMAASLTPPPLPRPLIDLRTASLVGPVLEHMLAAQSTPSDNVDAAGREAEAETPIGIAIESPAEGNQEPAIEGPDANAQTTEASAADTIGQTSPPVADEGESGQPTPLAEGATVGGEEETQIASIERPAEGAGAGEGVEIEVPPGALSDVYLATTVSDVEAAMVETAETEEAATEQESPRTDADSADEREDVMAEIDGLSGNDGAETQEAEAAPDEYDPIKPFAMAPVQDVWKAPSTQGPLILASISTAAGAAQLSQTPPTSIGLKLLLRTMPGLDRDLSRAIAHPEEPSEFLPTERRQMVLERMEAAAERG